ncbi:MAG: hypothetical protein ACKOXB_01310 [Flavobacteriales bacterium]
MWDHLRKRSTTTFLTINGNLKKAVSIFLYLYTFNLLASGNADVTIQGSSGNGSWSYAANLYTWTPDANSSTVNVADITACLLGSNTALGGNTALNSQTNGAHSVTILTACSGAGSQTGNVVHNSALTAATTSSTQFTFTITAAGSITINNIMNFTPASNSAAGYPATNIVFTAPSGITTNQGITSVGGTSTGAAVAGGVGGNFTCTASGGAVSIANAVTVTGGTGGTGGGAGVGGAGGTISITGTSVSVTQTVYSYGGQGSDTGAGGVGGTITITSTSTTVSIGNIISNSGGTGATTGVGGDGGPITITSATTLSVSQPMTTSGGNSGTGNGGNGGAVNLTTQGGALTISHAVTSNGGNPGGGSNKNGGNGGAISLTSSSTVNISQAMYSNGGTPTGSGTSNGGNITISAPGGITLSNIIQSTGTTAGGTLTLDDGNTSITSGGVNDGQSGGSYFQVGAVTKTGSGNFKLAHPSNSWTGATTITAGKLTLGATAVIPDASQLNFNGGRLVMGAYNETVGTIKISSYSILDLPAGNYTLTASASNGITWTTGQKLGINYWGDVGNNYNGTAAGGSDPKIYTGSSAELDATHLAAIYFRRTSNGLTYTATQLASGEIVPTATLPIELISFNAKKNTNHVDITWETASEINSDYFQIYRANTNMQWEKIGEINAAGTSHHLLHYCFVDHLPNSEINYYQLKEIDFDGTQQESKIVFVNFSNPLFLTTYPNPTNSSTTINFYSEKEESYYLKGVNAIGEEIFYKKISGMLGENRIYVPLEQLSTGIYSFLLYQNNELLTATKVFKKQ